MVKATLRTPGGDARVQTAAASTARPAAPSAPAPAAQAAAPRIVNPAPARAIPAGVIHPRGGAPARPAAPTVVAAPAAPKAPARAPVVTTAAPKAVTPVATRAPRIQEASPVPVIEVAAEVVPAASVDDQFLPPVETTTDTVPANATPEDSGPENPEDSAPDPTPSLPGAIVVRPPSAVARASDSDGPGLTGDWGVDDLRFPRLTIVRGSGALSQQFNDGTLLYADTELLPTPNVQPGAQNPSLYFVPLQIDRGWRENLTKEAQDAGQLPRNARTVEEVESMGGTTVWFNGVKPSWSPSAKCVLLIEKPEGSEHPGFVLPLDDREYAVALYYVSGGDFNAFAKNIYNTAKTVLQVPVTGENGQPKADERGRIIKRPMLYKNFWTLQYQKVKRGDFNVWSPVIRLQAKEETGPETRAYIEQLFSLEATEAATQAD